MKCLRCRRKATVVFSDGKGACATDAAGLEDFFHLLVDLWSSSGVEQERIDAVRGDMKLCRRARRARARAEGKQEKKGGAK